MAKRVFYVDISGHAEIEIDDAVFEAVDDEWRRMFYDLWDENEIAQMIARNLIVNRVPLSHLDGWADQPDNNAKVLSLEIYTDV